jgi:hypothetical protein
MQCFVSPLRTGGLLILALGLTFVSYIVGAQGSGYESWVGWFGVVLFGFGSLVTAKQLFNKAVVVSIDSQGILATRVARERVLWSAVDSVSIGEVRSSRFLCVWLKDEASYLRSLSTSKATLARMNRVVGFPAIAIDFQGLTPGLDEAFALACKYVPARAGAQQAVAADGHG